MATEQSITSILRRVAEEDPDRPLLTCGGVTLTRSELDRKSNRMARAYEAMGVGVGDFVSIGVPNSLAFFIAAAAAWKVGAVPQPISSRLPVRERQAIVELANSKLVVGASSSDHPGRTCIPADFEPDSGLVDSPLPDRVSPAWSAPTSGGSTGRPKLIVSAQSGMIDPNFGEVLWMEPSDRQLVAGPLYHNAPLAQAHFGIFMGQEVHVMPRFDAEGALDIIEQERITWVNLVPTMMLRMLRVIEQRARPVDLSSLRVVWHMAAPCPEWVKEAWIKLVGPGRLMELYRGTESQALTSISGTEWLEHRGSVGRPFRGEMVVLDAEGRPAAPGEIGEIFMRAGENVPRPYRYIGAEVRERDGWESLGDMGWMDPDGYLYIADRRTDMIVSGGANVYPAEVEAALSEHPAVLSCAVVGLPDEDLGARVHAVVQTTSPVKTADLVRHTDKRLVRYKVPRTWDFTDQPLRDDAGKVRRSAIREEIIQRLPRKADTSL